MTIVVTIPPALEILVSAVATVGSWIFGRVFFRYMFLPWLGHYLASKLGQQLKPSEREHIIVRHYAARRRGKIHQVLWPWRCNDGKCVLL